MKKHSIIAALALALLPTATLVSCQEDNTLDGADAIYIELTPTDFSLALRDTVAISARVTNVSGKDIDTKITWSVDDPSLVKILGDTAVTCINSARGQSTMLRATLPNNKYAVTSIAIVGRSTKGVLAYEPRVHSYYETPNDTVWFDVNPPSVLDESEPSYDFEVLKVNSVSTGASADFSFPENPIYVEKDLSGRPSGRVGFVFTAPRINGVAKVTLKVGSDNIMEDSAEILVYPNLNLSFYDDRENLPSPSTMGTLSTSMMMDVNSTATVGVSVGVAGMRDEDIRNAYGVYEWKIEGSSILPAEETTEYVPTHGYLANLKVKSGLVEGTSRVLFITPDTTLVANVTVDNFVKNHPVDAIVTDKESMVITAGRVGLLDVNVVPSASFEFHVPKVVSADPSIAAVQERSADDGTTVTIRGIKPGKTTLTITALDKTKKIPVEVVDDVASISWVQGLPSSITVGESVEFGVVVKMASGQDAQMPVNWTSSNAAVAKVSGNSSKASVTGVATGTATITAKCGDKSVSREIKVASNADRIISGNADIYDNEDGTFYLDCMADGESIAFVLPWQGHGIDSCDGTYTGKGDSSCLVYIGDAEYGVRDFDFTLKAEGGKYVANGYVTITTGLKLTFRNLSVSPAK